MKTYNFLALPLLMVALLGPCYAAAPFELDGNATSDSGIDGDDWDTLNTIPFSGSFVAKTGLVVDAPEPGLDPLDFHQFTGGGSKDQSDISSWGWRGGSPLDKNDITNAYAAAYIAVGGARDGHLILVMGSDRFDTSGNAQLGFWFLQDQVQPRTTPNGSFSGVHKDGDILVLSNFTNGGGTPTISVYKWVAGAVVLQGSAEAVLCTNDIPAGENFCGISNASQVTAPWPYLNKDFGGIDPNFPQSAFFEGAVDLTALGLEACITNFLAESRSSASITAVLKDFATPASGFNLCGISVTKNCSRPRLNAAQDKIIYDITGTVTNKPFGPVHNVSLSDDIPVDNPIYTQVDCTTGADLNLPFPLATLGSGASACYANTITVSLADNGKDDTITATANTKLDNTGIALTASKKADCPVLQISPAIKVSKACTTSVKVQNATVVAKVTVTGQVCNIGDTNLTNVNVVDLNIVTTPNPLLSGVTLVNPVDKTQPENTVGACAVYTGSYIPTAALDTNGVATTDPSAVVFKDKVRATGTPIFGANVTQDSDFATCPLCR